jgi:hypothetical protein
MLNVVMLNVAMLNVVAPVKKGREQQKQNKKQSSFFPEYSWKNSGYINPILRAGIR